LLVTKDTKEGVLAHAREPIHFINTSCTVEAWLRQAVIWIHGAGGALKTWQTAASRRQVPVHAFGSVLTQRRSLHKAIVDARSAQSPFPATRALAGKVIERVDALGIILAGDELTLV
jgi:hypothetical protein